MQPQKELDKVYRTRIEVADVLRKFRLQNIEHKYLSEEQAASQHFEVSVRALIFRIVLRFETTFALAERETNGGG